VVRILRFEDDPWRRLPWWAALATLLTFVSLMGFLRLLEQAPDVPSPPRLVEVQILEPPPRAPEPAPMPRPARVPPQPLPKKVEAPPKRVEPMQTRPPAPAPEPPPTVSEPVVAPPVTLPRADVVEPPTPSPEALPAPSVVTVNPGSPPTRPSSERPGATGPSTSTLPGPAPSSPGGASEGVPGGGNMGARAIYSPLPEIPDTLRRRNLELVAVARFRVAANGSAQVELTQPTSEPELNQALLASLKRWRFFPATQDGKPVASSIDIRVPISVR